MTWTKEAVDTLTFLWLQNWSASQIAALFCREGCTRNAVIGKVNRLGLCRAPKKRTPSALRTAAPAPSPAEPPLRSSNNIAHAAAALAAVGPDLDIPLSAPKRAPVSLTDVEPHHCRWPLGSGESFLFCGASRPDPAKPYCGEHTTLAHGVGTKGEREAAPGLNKRSHLTRAHT